MYIEFADFILAGWKDQALKMANFRNGPYWQMINDPGDKRKTLVQYDTLRPKDKERLTTQFGDPHEYIAKEPIKKLVIPDYKAEEFYRNYRYDSSKVLPFEHQQAYTTAASWLNMINRLNEDKRIIKKDLNLSVEKFWLSVCDIIKADNIQLPSSYRRLLDVMKTYKETGYNSLIDWRFGNKLSAKIGKTDTGFNPELHEKQIAFIRTMASMHQNFDAMQITSAVNVVFDKQGWPTISHATVYNVCKENSHLTISGSRGRKEYNNSVAMQFKRKRPEYPLSYFTLDGWTVEMLYQENGTYDNRLVIVIVLDAFNNYPIGYAIGDRENVELIRMANRNALTHINQLFGDNYKPRQLQSDNYGIKALTPFYTAMATLHTPAAVGNAKTKVIEPYFEYFKLKYCQPFDSFSGANIDSLKKNQPNVEYLDKIKHSFPDKATIIRRLEMAIAQERKIKIAAYLQAWQKLPDTEKTIMSNEDLLMVYGKASNYLNSITGQGLTISLGGEKITYDSFDPAFRALQFQKFRIMYDECDLDKVLAITEDEKRRFILERKRVLPMAVHDMQPADHDYRKQVTDFNKARVEEVLQTFEKDAAIVEEVMSNTVLNLNDFNEVSLKMMFTNKGQQKERLQDAKGLKKIAHTQQKQLKKDEIHQAAEAITAREAWLESNHDFNQFND